CDYCAPVGARSSASAASRSNAAVAGSRRMSTSAAASSGSRSSRVASWRRLDDGRGAAGGNGGECGGGRRLHGASRPRGTVGGRVRFAALLATALDPATAARTNTVEVIAARVGTVAVEVDADRTTAGAARTPAMLVAERRQTCRLEGSRRRGAPTTLRAPTGPGEGGDQNLPHRAGQDGSGRPCTRRHSRRRSRR